MQPLRDEYKDLYGFCIIFIQTVLSVQSYKQSKQICNSKSSLLSLLPLLWLLAAVGPLGLPSSLLSLGTLFLLSVKAIATSVNFSAANPPSHLLHPLLPAFSLVLALLRALLEVLLVLIAILSLTLIGAMAHLSAAQKTKGVSASLATRLPKTSKS